MATQIVSFEFLNFGIFLQFLFLIDWPVWQHFLTLRLNWQFLTFLLNFSLLECKCKCWSLRSQKWDNLGDFQTLCSGYDCTNEIMDIKEVSFTDQIRCYNTTEEVCSMTHITVFESRTEKQCDTHFKKVCWIDYADDSTSEVVRVCNKKPERKCNLSPEEKATVRVVQECRDYYESICETRYINKNITEDKVTCQTIQNEMCDDNGENCVNFPQNVRIP